jgi:cysteine synthase A
MIDADECLPFSYVFRITDAEAVAMARFLVERDGLFVGSSSACNLVAAVRYVKKTGWRDGRNVVTILWVPDTPPARSNVR